MIDLTTIKPQLSGITTRANRKAEAERWGTGDLRVTPTELLPSIESEEAQAALRRLAEQAQSLGPRIVNTKRFGIIGDLNWGGDNTLADKALREQDLETTVDVMIEQALYSGVIAGINRRDPDLGTTRIEPLIGHVEPIYSKDSPTYAVGLIHAWVSDAGEGVTRWTVRVYDLADRTMREWASITDPSRIWRTTPTNVVEASAEYPAGAPIPRFAVLSRDSDRLPMGEVAKLLPLLYADWSSQVRGDRIEESTAIPQMVVKGEVEDGTDERSPTHVIRVIEDGDAKYIIPGDLSGLHEHHNRKLERIREDGNLPGGFLGNQTPSGEALREANAKFISSNRYVASRASRVLTQLAADHCEAEQLGEPPEVTVTINREFARQQEITDIIALYREGLVSHAAAVRGISVFLPTWSDEEIEQFIQDEVERLRVPEFAPGAWPVIGEGEEGA